LDSLTGIQNKKNRLYKRNFVYLIKIKEMAKRLTREEKREQAVVDLINEMFKIAGHSVTYDDVKDRKDNWFQEYTMTEEQNEQWIKWGRVYLRKKLNLYAKQAEKEMMWINLMWGLKLDPSPFTKIKQNEQTESN
jgi:hypothetical protein